MMTKNSSKRRFWVCASSTIPLLLLVMVLFSGKAMGQSNEKVVKEEIEEYFQERTIVFIDEDGKRVEKKYSELTEEEKAKLPPPPPAPPASPMRREIIEEEVSEGEGKKVVKRKMVFKEGKEAPLRRKEVIEIHENGNEVRVKRQMRRIPPPAPPVPAEHMKELAEKGAVFYHNSKKITADQAVELMEEEQKHKKIKIKVKENEGQKPQVFIETSDKE